MHEVLTFNEAEKTKRAVTVNSRQAEKPLMFKERQLKKLAKTCF